MNATQGTSDHSKDEDRHERLSILIGELFKITRELKALFDRPFTPDGHLVGSLGEVIAADIYGLTLAPPSTKGYDATSRCNKEVQIKATFGQSVALRETCAHLIVLKLSESEPPIEIYNGPGDRVWELVHNKKTSNGQRPISLSALKKIAVEDSERIPRRRPAETAQHEQPVPLNTSPA